MGINEWMNNGGIRGKMAAGKHTVSDWLTDRPHGSYGRCPSPYLSPLATVSSLGSCCCLCCCCAWLRVKFARGLGPQQSQSCFLINFHRKKEKKEKQAEKWQCWDDFLNLGLRRARLLWGWGCTLYTDRHTYICTHTYANQVIYVDCQCPQSAASSATSCVNFLLSLLSFSKLHVCYVNDFKNKLLCAQEYISNI